MFSITFCGHRRFPKEIFPNKSKSYVIQQATTSIVPLGASHEASTLDAGEGKKENVEPTVC